MCIYTHTYSNVSAVNSRDETIGSFDVLNQGNKWFVQRFVHSRKFPSYCFYRHTQLGLRALKKSCYIFFTFGNLLFSCPLTPPNWPAVPVLHYAWLWQVFLMGFFPHLKARFQPAPSVGSVTNCLHVLVVSDCLSQPFLQLLICIVNHRIWRGGY